MNTLIDRVKFTYRMTEKEIMKRIGYNDEYLSQTRSRGKVSDKFMQKLRLTFPEAGNVQPPADDMTATVAVLIDRVSSLLSDRSGRSAQIERELIAKDAEELKKIRKA